MSWSCAWIVSATSANRGGSVIFTASRRSYQENEKGSRGGSESSSLPESATSRSTTCLHFGDKRTGKTSTPDAAEFGSTTLRAWPEDSASVTSPPSSGETCTREGV